MTAPNEQQLKDYEIGANWKLASDKRANEQRLHFKYSYNYLTSLDLVQKNDNHSTVF